ncbi:Phospho-2-dehydro-3-deoxyheptonate aldolase, Tyr-sensitive [Desulfonema limicola]|uniref:Phospho-2-dehydro-3-deoxyheptonate aldolase n=1 Tax=Desulfonema limicola TaxID=45656 RepID=A0A975B9U6_9BACT|nr:3-deoxy-7-phosphoheptulonate synthase [Desulfonema limicola]QTA81487.1 Phospho-2-dehydro-3-deoxyheptonate aldolase, Tyr-sensitive [Desulfonema limicola]
MNYVNIDTVKQNPHDEAMSLRQINIAPVPEIQNQPIQNRFILLKSPGLKKADVKYIKNEENFLPLISPSKLKHEIPVSREAFNTLCSARQSIKNILTRQDKRILVITGPCSIHDEKSALEYAEKLRILKNRVQDTLLIVMRVYFEKPRTSTGWKGMISDPHMNSSFDMTAGLRKARDILLRINEMGIPAGTEMLEPSTPAYIADLISWSAVGARTTESQIHREMASGLPMPVGFKNSTDGGLDAAVNAIKAASSAQSFPAVDQNGRTNIMRTKGNPWAHIVLRGGKYPNYDFASIESAQKQLKKNNLMDSIIVDCSHGNSDKDFRKQGRAWNDVMRQRKAGNKSIAGLMLESHLNEGSQKPCPDLSKLEYGVSITDPCIGWQETEKLILSAHEMLKEE